MKPGAAHPLPAHANLVLIGMPGVGKSTVGVLLAKATARAFVDTDLLIQAAEGCSLEALLQREGVAGFLAAEARTLDALDVRGHVIATGGSAVHADAAMTRLRGTGVCVHLCLGVDALARRLDDLRVRGVAVEPGRTLHDLAREREPLYRRYADLSVDTEGLHQDTVVARILEALPHALPHARLDAQPDRPEEAHPAARNTPITPGS